MTPSKPSQWQTANQNYLSQALVEVQQHLEALLQQQQGETTPERPGTPSVPTPPDKPLNLDLIVRAFRLSPFEKLLLLLCAGTELSATLSQLCASIHGSPTLAYPTFSLALAAFPESHWSALSLVGALRQWRLIEIESGKGLTQSRLRIDERVLHYLNGVSYLDDRLRGIVHLIQPADSLPGPYQTLAQQVAQQWTRRTQTIVQLYGAQKRSQETIAAAACQQGRLQLYSLQINNLPKTTAERDALARLWERESILERSGLVVDCHGSENKETLQQAIDFIESVHGRVIVLSEDPLVLPHTSTVRFEVLSLNAADQKQVWQAALGGRSTDVNGHLEQLVAQFHLEPIAIQEICAGLPENLSQDSFQILWQACRQQSRTHLHELAQHIIPRATWDHLVLPEPQRRILQEITAQVRQRAKVYDQWKFAVPGANGTGISALFVGASGTGKTLAAEVLAHDLNLDLYRIDLSQVVSKYIGETEKNLRQVFDTAEASGAILLFDEADALFGKRSTVKDSHDRYANIEVSYLLQRMEAYGGLAILTTNLKKAIDQAFLRRIRFVVQFPFPDLSQREEIWQRMFPPKLPTEGLDWQKLARLNVPGGNIRSIALNGAFLAADAGEPVGMHHLLRAAQTEYAKLEKTPTTAEIGGWV